MREFKISLRSITDRSEENVNRYINDIAHYEMISPDEEARLAQIIRKGGIKAEKAKEKLIKANLRFVISVAKQYKNKNIPLADLISDGNIGLVKAAQDFDETRGFKFISYAVWWIRQSISSSLKDYTMQIRLPQNRQKIINDYYRMDGDMMQLEQRHITIDEFCEVSKVSKEIVEALVDVTQTSLSMDAPIMTEENDSTIGETMPSENNTDEEIDKESLHTDLERLLCTILKPRDMDILCRAYGIGRHEENLEQIAAEHGLTRERARQISVKAISTIRKSKYSSVLRKYL